MTDKSRNHPIAIAQNMQRFIFFLIVPVLRGLYLAVSSHITDLFSGDWLVRWLRGAWIDVSIVLVLTAFSVLQWMVCKFECKDKILYIEKGVIFREEKYVPVKNIVTLSCAGSIFTSVFGAVKLYADTLAGGHKKPDVSLIVRKKTAESVFSHDGTGETYRPKNIYIIAISALTSNSIVGIVLIATFVNQSGKILGEEFQNSVYSTFSNFTQLLSLRIHPAAASLALVLVIGWLIAFGNNILRHKNLTAVRSGGKLYVYSGVVITSKYIVNVEKIGFVDIRQSLLAKILGIFSAYINAVGYGKTKSGISVLIPAVKSDELEFNLGRLLPEYKKYYIPSQAPLIIKNENFYTLCYKRLNYIHNVIICRNKIAFTDLAKPKRLRKNKRIIKVYSCYEKKYRHKIIL